MIHTFKLNTESNLFTVVYENLPIGSKVIIYKSMDITGEDQSNVIHSEEIFEVNGDFSVEAPVDTIFKGVYYVNAVIDNRVDIVSPMGVAANITHFYRYIVNKVRDTYVLEDCKLVSKDSDCNCSCDIQTFSNLLEALGTALMLKDFKASYRINKMLEEYIFSCQECRDDDELNIDGFGRDTINYTTVIKST